MVSLTFCAGVDDPAWFAKPKSLGACFGLTPKRYQSGKTGVISAITRVGDAGVRTTLHDAANALLTRATKFSTLKRWAMNVAKRRGMRRARMVPARKLSTVLHRIWADGEKFVWGKDSGRGHGRITPRRQVVRSRANAAQLPRGLVAETRRW